MIAILNIMVIKKVKPMFNSIIVTARKYTIDETKDKLIVEANKTAGNLKEYQEVIAVGTTVRDIKVGDLVLINPTRYARRKHQEGSLKDGVIMDNPVTHYEFNMLEIDGIQYIKLFDQDIDMIIEDWEEDSPKSEIIVTEPSIII